MLFNFIKNGENEAMSNWITIQVEKGPKYVSSFLFKNEWKVSHEGLLKMLKLFVEPVTTSTNAKTFQRELINSKKPSSDGLNINVNTFCLRCMNRTNLLDVLGVSKSACKACRVFSCFRCSTGTISIILPSLRLHPS